MSVSVNPDSRTTTWNPGQIGASCCGYIGMYYSFIISRHHPILITVSSIIVIIDFQIYVILLYLFCFKGTYTEYCDLLLYWICCLFWLCVIYNWRNGPCSNQASHIIVCGLKKKYITAMSYEEARGPTRVWCFLLVFLCCR